MRGEAPTSSPEEEAETSGDAMDNLSISVARAASGEEEEEA